MRKKISKIYNLIVPTKKNKYRPYFLLSDTLFLVVVSLFVLKIISFIFLCVFPKTNFFADVSRSILLSLTNNQRANSGISILKEDSKLNQAAYLKAKDMLDYDYFAHTSPSGKTPWYWLDLVGYNYQYAGENLAIDFVDSEELFQAWYSSSTHRANIINPKFQDIGIAVLKGEFQGRETTVVVQFFGTPMPVQTVQAKTPSNISSQPSPTIASPPQNTVSVPRQSYVSPKTQEPQPLYVSTPGGMTLYDYYKSKGQPLPSISERAKIYEKLGLGPASSYKGLAWQNNLLLNKLLELEKKESISKQSQAPAPTQTPTPTPTPTPSSSPSLSPTPTLTPTPTPTSQEKERYYLPVKNVHKSFPTKTIDLVLRNYESITRIIFLTILGVIFLSLCVDIFVKFNIQHADIILRGAIYTFVLLTLVLLDKNIILKLIPHNLAIL
jgi:uncharacterized protein YkwD